MQNWSFKRHMTAALRFGFAAMIIVGLFWGVFYLTSGSFPAVTTIGHSDHGIHLPFTYVRWMDVPLAFLSVVIGWLIYAAVITTTVRDREDETNANMGLICGWILGLVWGILCASLVNFYPLIIIIFPIILAALLTIVHVLFSVSGSLMLAASACLGVGAVLSIDLGVGPGLVVGLIGVAINYAALLVIYGWRSLIDAVVEQGLAGVIWDWLTAAGVNGK
jgi:hypothetical protein